jgi:hypothetical protein
MTIRSSRLLRNKKSTLNVVSSSSALVDHEWVNTPLPPRPIFASSRPLGKAETQFLREGQRRDDYRMVNCDDVLFAADDKLGIIGDIIVNHLGFDWCVIQELKWGNGTRHNSYQIQKTKKATP